MVHFNVGILGLLGVLFVALKLTNFIAWSWWWVLLPFWGTIAVWLVLLAIAAILSAAVVLTSEKRRW